MKRMALAGILVLLLTACTPGEDLLQRGMDLRGTLLTQGCSFRVRVTGDYGDKSCHFEMECSADPEGNLQFTVTEPEPIGGIRGSVQSGKGALTFSDTVLAFPLLADGEVSPVSGPWLLMKALRSGYLHAAGMDGDLLRLTVYDSYEEDALQLDVWLDGNNIPLRGEILWQGRRVLSMEVKDFGFV